MTSSSSRSRPKNLGQITVNRDGHSAEKLVSGIESNSGSFGIEQQMDPETMIAFRTEVTSKFIDDLGFDYEKNGAVKRKQERYDFYVNLSRLQELFSIKSTSFDLGKLIRLCEELNGNWKKTSFILLVLSAEVSSTTYHRYLAHLQNLNSWLPLIKFFVP